MSLKSLSKLFGPAYVSMSDEDLMKLIQQDKEGAFAELYTRYSNPFYNYFSRLTSSTLAEDLMQDTFIKVLNRRMSYRFESKLRAWLWIIAKNTLRDYWRSTDYKMKNSFDPLINEEGQEVYESSMNSQEESLFEKMSNQQLLTCIENLAVDQREIVLLHIHSELSNQEIAQLQNISVGAVKSVLHRSKAKLIECFKRGGVCEQ